MTHSDPDEWKCCLVVFLMLLIWTVAFFLPVVLIEAGYLKKG